MTGPVGDKTSWYGWSAEGEVISDQFQDAQGLPLCKEVAIRAKTMEIYRHQLESERNYLLHQLIPGERQIPIRERIRAIDHKLRAHEEGDASWASTNSPRLLFEKLGPSEAKKVDIPVVGNLRVHRLDFKDGTSYSINRSAALSDFVHSETSLSELKDYLSIYDESSIAHFQPEHVNYFKYYYDNRDVTKSSDWWMLRQSMENHIYSAYGTKDVRKLHQIIAERRDNLRRHALQDLYMHFQSHPVAEERVTYGRVALLDSTKAAKTDKTGYHLDEKNQLMDMKAIYDELDGTPILFDLSEQEGPFFDMEGRIHMPKQCCATELQHRPVRLQTILFNVSVQGNTRNAPLQYYLNQHAMSKLQSMGMNPDLMPYWEALNRKLKFNSETDFATAHQAIFLLRRLGYCSVNCYGGKDRTGYALALETFCAIDDKLKEKALTRPIPEKKLNDTLAAIGRKLLSSSSVAVKIVDDNTGFQALKLSRFDLELLLSGEGINWLLGAATRLKGYLQSCQMLIQGKGQLHDQQIKKMLYHHPDNE